MREFAEPSAVVEPGLVAAHLFGRADFVDDRDWMLAHVSSLTDAHEAAEPAPWAVADAADVVAGAAAMLGSSCWRNSPQAPSAIDRGGAGAFGVELMRTWHQRRGAPSYRRRIVALSPSRSRRSC